jgi:hypothetical protein
MGSGTCDYTEENRDNGDSLWGLRGSALVGLLPEAVVKRRLSLAAGMDPGSDRRLTDRP